MAKMELSMLKAMLSAEKADALAATASAKLSSERSNAMDYYLGDMRKDMPANEGESSAVSTDVADTVEGLMPSLMEIFCGSDEVVAFNPVSAQDVQAAEQETDYVNHVFMQRNPGFLVLYSFIKDALLQKVGVVKVWWETREEEQRETYLDQTDDAFALLAQAVLQSDGALRIEEHTQKEEPGAPDPQTGQPTPIITHDVTIVTTQKFEQARVEGVPPEEFGIERNARSIPTSNYCFHKIVTLTESDLIEQGYDERQIKTLQTYGNTSNTEELSRDSVDEEYWADNSTNTGSRIVELVEHYIRMDYEGKGRACLYKVTTGGGQEEILRKDGKPDIEQVDVMPFAAMTPVIITHRFFGRSIADLVMDIQKIKTALLRAMLNAQYLANNPRTIVYENLAGPNTLDDLLVSRNGGIIRAKSQGAVEPYKNPSIGGDVLPVIEYMDATREWRTGVTRQGQGIDANSLQNVSATASAQGYSAAQARMKLIARIFAETGIRDLFQLLHGVIRKHATKKDVVELRKQWVEVDPRGWKTRNDMTVKVGLGSGTKQEKAANLTALMGLQEKALMGGLPIVSAKNVYNAAKEFCKVIDLKDVDPYMTDPASPEGQQMAQAAAQKPDPKMQELQMKAALEEKADQRKAGIEQVQAQADIATQDKKTQAEMVQQERDFQLKRELALFQAQLDQQKFEAEEARKDREHQQKMEQSAQMHQHAIEQGQFSLAAGAQAHAQKMDQAAHKNEAGA
jgi:hypothetical protein